MFRPTPIEAISVREARALLDADARVLFIDVRDPDEFDAGHIPGALNMPWTDGKLRERLDDLPDCLLIVYCGSGRRSHEACAFLRNAGRPRIRLLSGGYLAWREEA